MPDNENTIKGFNTDAGVLPVDYNSLANKPTIPSKTSDIENDSGFVTEDDIPTIPSKTSELTNDSGFITAEDIPAPYDDTQVKSDITKNTNDISTLNTKYIAIETDIYNEFDYENISDGNDYTWVNATIAHDGKGASNTKAIRTNSFHFEHDVIMHLNDFGGKNLRIAKYDNDGSISSQVFLGWIVEGGTGTVPNVLNTKNAIFISANTHFALCVSKADLSNLTDTDKANIKSSISFGKTIKAQISDNAEAIDGLLGVTDLVPADYPANRCRIRVFKNKDGYYTDFDVRSKIIPSANTVYVSPNGVDTNDGLTWYSPLKTFESAISNGANTIVLLEGEYICGTHYQQNLRIQNRNIIGIGNVVCRNTDNGDPILFSLTNYVENIKFIGGKSCISASVSVNDYLALNNCLFDDADTDNCCTFKGGNYYLYRCKAINSRRDGFNYHYYSTSNIAQAVEIECESYRNGKTTGTTGTDYSCNASTIHNGCSIIRLNGKYGVSHGSIIGDTDSFSVNFGCNCKCTFVADTDDMKQYNSSFWSRNNKMWLYDCTSFGSQYDLSVVGNGFIYTNIEYTNIYNDGTGTIEIIQ